MTAYLTGWLTLGGKPAEQVVVAAGHGRASIFVGVESGKVYKQEKGGWLMFHVQPATASEAAEPDRTAMATTTHEPDAVTDAVAIEAGMFSTPADGIAKLKAYMNQRGISYGELSRALGHDDSSQVSRWMNLRVEPRTSTLHEIQRALATIGPEERGKRG